MRFLSQLLVIIPFLMHINIYDGVLHGSEFGMDGNGPRYPFQ